jgi:hypothetical protein
VLEIRIFLGLVIILYIMIHLVFIVYERLDIVKEFLYRRLQFAVWFKCRWTESRFNAEQLKEEEVLVASGLLKSSA